MVGGGCWGERQGPEVCLGGRRLSVAVNRGLFDAIVLAQACLSPGVAAIKDADSRQRCLHRAGNARADCGTLAHLHLAHKLWRESVSVNYEGAQTFSPEDERENNASE